MGMADLILRYAPRPPRSAPQASPNSLIMRPARAAIAAARRTKPRNVFAAGMPAMLPGRGVVVVNEGADRSTQKASPPKPALLTIAAGGGGIRDFATPLIPKSSSFC